MIMVTIRNVCLWLTGITQKQPNCKTMLYCKGMLTVIESSIANCASTPIEDVEYDSEKFHDIYGDCFVSGS